MTDYDWDYYQANRRLQDHQDLTKEEISKHKHLPPPLPAKGAHTFSSNRISSIEKKP